MTHRSTLTILILEAVAVASCAGQVFTEDFKLAASDAREDDYFGYTVSISGTTAIVGAYGDEIGEDPFIGSGAGSSYLFDITTGQQVFKLTATDAATNDFFGTSVDISGTTAIVGAYGDDDAGNRSGSAYLFDTTTGQQLFKLRSSVAGAEDYFGYSVAISGNVAIVGAYQDDLNGQSKSGAAFLFETSTGEEIYSINQSDARSFDRFGKSVAISGQTAIVGAPGDDIFRNGVLITDAGSAYLIDTTTGEELLKLTASDAASNDHFGESVAISGTTAIVSGGGSAYLFDTTTGQQLFKLNSAAGGSFGPSVAISGTAAIVTGGGNAFVFETTTGRQAFGLAASDAAGGDGFGVSVAASGSTAIVGAWRDILDVGTRSGSAYLFNLTADEPCLADFTGEGLVNFFDIAVYIQNYNAGDPVADLSAPFGTLNFFDISAFIGLYNAGCRLP